MGSSACIRSIMEYIGRMLSLAGTDAGKAAIRGLSAVPVPAVFVLPSMQLVARISNAVVNRIKCNP